MYNYPDGMSSRDLWYVGEIADRYGHWIGEGYAFDDPEYNPDLDDDYIGEEEEDDEDDDYEEDDE